MRTSGWVAVACVAMLGVACDRTARDNDSTVITDNESADRTDLDDTTIGTSGFAGDAENFARQAMLASKAEIRLGELAQQRAQNADVKQFARTMVTDHGKGLNDLKQAVNNKVQEPAELDAEHQALYDRLSRLSGAEFDREYMKAMVDGHRKVKDMVEERAERAPATRGTSGRTADDSQVDQGTRQWASATLPKVTQHLQQAEQIHDRLK